MRLLSGGRRGLVGVGYRYVNINKKVRKIGLLLLRLRLRLAVILLALALQLWTTTGVRSASSSSCRMLKGVRTPWHLAPRPSRPFAFLARPQQPPPSSQTSRQGLVMAAAGRDDKPRVIVVTGPTAVGKSSLALQLCRELRGEIISVDSVQVYRCLDIGSNKPTPAERAAVPHHLLDVLEANAEVGAQARRPGCSVC